MEETNFISRNTIVNPQPELGSRGQKETKSKIVSIFLRKNKRVILIVSLGLFASFLFVLFGYYLGKNSMLDKVIPQSIRSALFKEGVDGMDSYLEMMEGREEVKREPTVCDKESKKILSVVDKFEKFQKERKSSEILALFTDASTDEEKNLYNSLKGKDGLYIGATMNFKTDSYRVTNGPVEDNGKCIVYVEERRSYPEKDNTEKYQEARGRSFVLELQKGNGKEWVINQYQSFEANIKKTKYSGFTMEVMK
ncbi:MAG TPA: hypothetical protein PLG10_00295 [Candidatus Dojkabacteria bacterium]|jgi:hypothetical protein|nr:hypothetical protein [Candidatus Dojkabacteria bacterium]